MPVDLRDLPIRWVDRDEHARLLLLNGLSEIGMKLSDFDDPDSLLPEPMASFEAAFLARPERVIALVDDRPAGEIPPLRDELDCTLAHELVHAWQHQEHPEFFDAIAAAKKQRADLFIRHLGAEHPAVQEAARRVDLLYTLMEGHAVAVEEQLRRAYFPNSHSPYAELGDAPPAGPDLSDKQLQYSLGSTAAREAMQTPGLIDTLLGDPEQAIQFMEAFIARS